ncbi:MAG: ABC transporter permease subunit [Anaerolineae bacterium]|nr:ABC transporter permease subunit [Anaerolineae bacterium]
MAVLAKPRNPIHWQELNHFQRTAQSWQRYELPIGIASIAALLLVMWYFVQSNFNYRAMQYAIPAIWIFHALVAMRAIIAGVNVISREHVGLTWESLVLTGVSGRQILLGKFGAALRTVMPWTILLSILRTLMLPMLSIQLTQTYAGYTGYYVTNSSYYANYVLPNIDWVPWAWLAAPVLTVLLTVLEVMACVALGLVASALTRRSMTAAVLAITVRFVPVAVFAGFARYSLGSTWFWRYWGYTPFTLADGGTVSLMQLAFPLISWTQGDHLAALPGVFGTVIMLLMFLVGSLGLALWLIRRHGALRHQADVAADAAYRVFRA